MWPLQQPHTKRTGTTGQGLPSSSRNRRLSRCSHRTRLRWRHCGSRHGMPRRSTGSSSSARTSTYPRLAAAATCLAIIDLAASGGPQTKWSAGGPRPGERRRRRARSGAVCSRRRWSREGSSACSGWQGGGAGSHRVPNRHRDLSGPLLVVLRGLVAGTPCGEPAPGWRVRAGADRAGQVFEIAAGDRGNARHLWKRQERWRQRVADASLKRRVGVVEVATEVGRPAQIGA